MKLKRLIITMSAAMALCLPAAAQTWGDKLIKRMQGDATAEKSIVVNRDSQTKKIDTESYTFRFKSATTYNSLMRELNKHLDDADMFTQEDDKGRLVMRVSAGKDRVGIYEIRKESPGLYCFKVYRSSVGISKALQERDRLLREDPEARASYQNAFEEAMDMRERILREAKEEEAREKAAYDAGRAQYDRLTLEGKQQARKDRINSEQGVKAARKAARVAAQREAQKARVETQKARVAAQRDAQKARVEAQKARVEAQKARAEAQREAQKARVEAQKARAEAQREAQKARVEAQKARSEAQREAQKARIEAQKARAEAQREVRKTSTTPRVRIIKSADKAAKTKEAASHENDVKSKLAEQKKKL